MWTYAMALAMARDGEPGRGREGPRPSPLRSVPGYLATPDVGDPEPVSDGVAFNDPRAWGFCRYCAFSVAVVLEDGRMMEHKRRTGSWDHERCGGSGRKPTRQLRPEMTPRPEHFTPKEEGDE